MALSKHFVVPYDGLQTHGPFQSERTLSRAKMFASVLAAKALLHQVNNEHSQTLGAYQQALTLSDRLCQGGFRIHRLVGMAMKAITLHSMQKWIGHQWVVARPPAEVLSEIVRFMGEFDKQHVSLWKTVTMETWRNRWDCEDWYAGTIPQEEIKRLAEICPEIDQPPAVDKATALNLWERHYQQLMQTARSPLWEALDSELPESTIAQLDPFLFNAKAFARWLWKEAMIEVELRGTQIMAALELYRYHQPHQGRYPPTLADLVPKYLPEVPKDPFTGQDFPYVRPDNLKYKLYGVGPNKVDDGGVQEDNIWHGDPDMVIYEVK